MRGPKVRYAQQVSALVCSSDCEHMQYEETPVSVEVVSILVHSRCKILTSVLSTILAVCKAQELHGTTR